MYVTSGQHSHTPEVNVCHLWRGSLRALTTRNNMRLEFVRMEIIRNENLFTKFKAAVCNMERRTAANPAVSAIARYGSSSMTMHNNFSCLPLTLTCVFVWFLVFS